jgi:hypothetical protein
MADATVKLTPGTGTCQHVRVEITHEGETRTFTCLKDEIINGEQDIDQKFRAIFSNVKTNIKLSGETDITKAAASVNSKGFKI